MSLVGTNILPFSAEAYQDNEFIHVTEKDVARQVVYFLLLSC